MQYDMKEIIPSTPFTGVEKDNWINNRNPMNIFGSGPSFGVKKTLGKMRSQAVCDALLNSRFSMVHYAASGVDHKKKGKERICSINVLQYPEDVQYEFSLVKAADLIGVAVPDIMNRIDDLEEVLLERFLRFHAHSDGRFFVYYAYGPEFGLKSIARRAQKFNLNVDPEDFERAVNLYDLTWPFFGGRPPRSSIEVLFKKNRILPGEFRSGKKEKELFARGEFEEICQSTSVKTRMFMYVMVMMKNKKLISPNKSFLRRFAELFASLLSYIATWIYEHPIRKMGTGIIVFVTIIVFAIEVFVPNFGLAGFIRDFLPGFGDARGDVAG